MKEKEHTVIIDQSIKSWWSGDSRVEKYMEPVSKAILRHIPKGQAYTDIYNKSYEAVYNAIKGLGEKKE